jgi:formate-dependent nitrite reductase membrane component NrfD
MVMLYELWPWKIPEYAPWGWIVALYLFLGGVGGGSYVTAAVADLLGKEKYHDIVKSGAIISPIVLIVGSILLLADLGDPLRGILVPIAFVNPTSWMAWGAWFLLVLIILGIIYAYAIFAGKDRSLRLKIAIPGLILGVAVGAYTGFLLSVLRFVPLWHTNLLPLLFTISAMSTGIAAALFFPLLSRVTSEKMDAFHKFSIADDILVALELIFIALLIAVVSKNEFGMESVRIITSGTYALPFWIGVIGIGLVVPLVLSGISLTLAKTSRALPLLEFFCILVGGVVLRFIIVYAAVKQPIFFPTLP